MECYLWFVKDVYKRALISRFRMGVLSLRIETGRYEGGGVIGSRGLPVKFRVCMCCELKKVEDEIHFLLECPCFESMREELFRVCRQKLGSKFFVLLNDVQELFISLMQSEEADIWRALADFISVAYQHRIKYLKSLHISN